ncbi:MAG: LPS export ABC transporter periplasmic protein LptC [Elusimicrobiota bacterium]
MVLILILSAFMLTACSNMDNPLKEDLSKIGPEQEIEQFNIKETKDGKPNWILNAKTAQIIESEQKVLLDAPKIDFFQKGKYVSTLISKKGRINTETYDIWGDGDCLLTTTKGETLKTKNLHYRSDTQRIVTDEKVRLIRPDEVIDGEGLEATPDLEIIKIKNQKVTMNK